MENRSRETLYEPLIEEHKKQIANSEIDKREEPKDKTRKMQEDEWKIGQEHWKTKRRDYTRETNFDSNQNIKDEIFEEQEKNKPKNEKDRKTLLRELIDSVGSSIEEIKKKKLNGTPEFKKNKNIDIENSLKIKILREFGSGSKDLGPIIEEENEEVY